MADVIKEKVKNLFPGCVVDFGNGQESVIIEVRESRSRKVRCPVKIFSLPKEHLWLDYTKYRKQVFTRHMYCELEVNITGFATDEELAMGEGILMSIEQHNRQVNRERRAWGL